MRYLLPYIKRYKKETVIAPLFKCLEACFDLLVPLIVADIIDVGIKNGDKGYILNRFGLLVAMAVLGLSCSVIAQFFAARASVGTATALRHDLLARIQCFGFPELDRHGASTLVTRMTSDVMQVQTGYNMFLRLFLRSPFIVLGAFILSIVIDVKLSLIFLGMIILLFLIVFGTMALTKQGYRRVQKCMDDVAGEVRENLSGVRVIRAFGREEGQAAEFCEANTRLYRAQICVGKLAALLNPLTYLVVNSAIILVLYFGSRQVDGGVLLSGNIIALISYATQISVELVRVASTIVLLGKAGASLGRISVVLDTEAGMCYGDELPTESEEAVRFSDVSFRYEGAGDDSLSHVSFCAMRGETVGVIGGTGSGKSTLVHLIPRLYDASEGEVFLLGKPIRSLSRAALLSAVSVVEQKAYLFSGTVRSNLLIANEHATDEEMWAALGTAQAADFVRERGGLDAVVERGGTNFSGGQRQRLTIARALLSGAQILILDDSTSALDFATDAALRRAIRDLPKNITLFIISQRVGSLAHADRILVLEDGELVGCGKHDALLSSSEVYREIYESQLEKGGEEK